MENQWGGFCFTTMQRNQLGYVLKVYTAFKTKDDIGDLKKAMDGETVLLIYNDEIHRDRDIFFERLADILTPDRFQFTVQAHEYTWKSHARKSQFRAFESTDYLGICSWHMESIPLTPIRGKLRELEEECDDDTAACRRPAPGPLG